MTRLKLAQWLADIWAARTVPEAAKLAKALMDELYPPGGVQVSQLASFARVPGSAVGAGIAATIQAQATRADADSPEAWVHFCCTAADEAYSTVMDSPPIVLREVGSVSMLLRHLNGEPEDEQPTAVPEALEGGELTAAAHSAALVAFRACMPKLTGRRATQAYIACVAVGVQRGYFTGSESKALLYTAQLALSAHPSGRKSTRRK